MKKIALGLLMLAGVAQAEVLEVRAEPGTDEKLAAAVQKSLESYNAILKQELGVELQKSARIDICPNLECYRNKRWEGGLRGDQLDKAVRSTSGTANAGKRQITVKLMRASQLKNVNKLVSHELTHFLQNELSEDSNRQPNWIHEGMADFVGALVAQKMGSQSFDKWKLDLVNQLRSAENYPSPKVLSEIANSSYSDWRDLTDQYKGRNYAMADLMMAYLYEQKGRKLFDALIGYYRCLSGSFTSETTCFTQNFAVAPEPFYRDVEVWVSAELAKSGGLEVVSNGQDAIAAEMESNYQIAQSFLENKLGRKLGITMRILLSSSKEELVEHYAQELGLSDEDALKRANRGNGWSWQDSLAFVDISRLNSAEKRSRVLGQIAMGRYLQTRAGNMNKTYWLYSGLREWMSEQLLEKLGHKSRADLLTQRAQAKSEKGAPALSELLTQDDWNKAIKKYGATTVLQVAIQATESLIDKKGLPALADWVDQNKQLKGSPEAFTKAFGETQLAFAESLAIKTN